MLVLCLTLGMIPTPIHAEETCSHVYDVYGNCTVCGYYCPHQWVDGSCGLCGCHCQHDYVDMVCTVCAMPCAHSWQEGFCPLCGAVCAHSYEAIITAPSCEEGGYTTYTCACGDSYVAEEVPALGHSYEQGCCTACGAEDPNYIYGELQTATLVTDASALSVGDRIIIAAADYSYALSTTQNTNNRGQANIAKDGSTVTFGTQTQIITLAAGAVEGTFALSVEDGKYLYASSSSSNTLKTQSTLNSNGSWHILISADGTAAITRIQPNPW